MWISLIFIKSGERKRENGEPKQVYIFQYCTKVSKRQRDKCPNTNINCVFSIVEWVVMWPLND